MGVEENLALKEMTGRGQRGYITALEEGRRHWSHYPTVGRPQGLLGRNDGEMILALRPLAAKLGTACIGCSELLSLEVL